MEGGINLDATLDYVEFHLFSSQNRYEASVWSSNKEEKLASGQLEQLLLHSPEIKKLSSKHSNTKFKILRPDSVNNASWFTTPTLTRFLHVIGLPDVLSITKEISQLEETREFLISSSDKAEVDITTSIESKSEVVLAVDLRLTALKEELAAAINHNFSSKYSFKDISDLENFALHFGAKDLRDALQRSVELSSIEDEDSSDEDELEGERSRARTRSSMPKRSASPMRRIQIGRSGSRRATALSIRSLNYFPGREKSTSIRDEGVESGEDEDSQRPVKNNVLRMSVQDKISLFESKQREQGVVNVQKTTKTSSNVTVGANKTVLRRWSSGMGESAVPFPQDDKTEPENNNSSIETCAETKNIRSEDLEEEVDAIEPEREESDERHPDSVEWSEEKGAELNDMFMKMMESKAVKYQSVTSDTSKSKIQKEQRGGFYDQYNKKREEKLQRQVAGKRVEKDAQIEPRKTQRNSTQLINSRTTKPSAVKKSPTKSSPSPVKTPTRPTSTNSTPPNRKPNSAPSVVRSTTKVENLRPRFNTSKATQPDANKRINATNKKQPTAIENRKTTKTKVQTRKEDANLTTKPSFYNKVTKKSSVVPLETKPFLRKGSGIGPGVGPVVVKTRVVAPPEETSRTGGGPIQGEENTVVKTIDIMIINHENECETPKDHATSSDSELQVVEESESCGGDLRIEVSEINTATEETIEISSNAWEEKEEDHEIEIIPCEETPIKIESATNGFLRPRLRPSLSQMLLEDPNEGDTSEWGNAEHPPTLVYQKDAPRGLKRLLKFARKAKADSHLTDWANPSGFSEGEDDNDESKATRSFFSLSAFRGNKTNETKILHR